ncbi:MAG: hypothetical protein ABEK59_08035 [Halobacteria archaeon]
MQADQNGFLMVNFNHYDFIPLSYTEVSPDPAQVLYVGANVSGSADLTVPSDAKKVQIQAIDADLRLCLDPGATASSSFGQLYPKATLPLTLLLNSELYITAFSTGTVGVYWGK